MGFCGKRLPEVAKKEEKEYPVIKLYPRSADRRTERRKGKDMNQGAGRYGTHRGAFEKNRKKIYQTQRVCGICGKPVDFKLKYPHPLAPCIDHIIPISKGGHPSDLENMQLAHWTCNRKKSDKLVEKKMVDQNADIISNRVLPHSVDWKNFSSKE